VPGNVLMRRLMLFRHAKSDRNQPGKGDHERVLNARGSKDAPLMGAYLSHHGFVPDLALVSTAARTQETWALAAKALPKTALRLEERLYEASNQTVLELIMGVDAKVKSLILVGHNPSIHDVAASLVGTGDLEARQRLQEKFPTAGIAIIDFAIEDWRKLRAASGRLERFVSPRMLAAAID
jgi:phosphohistidine phosphatase